MRKRRSLSAGLLLLLAAAGWVASPSLHAQLPGQLPGVEPLHDSGQDVTPAFEGWYKNPDGSFDIVFGYHNRNLKQEIDIPIGPNNRIEPGNADQGQPTHFMPRRGWGVFTITVPRDFGTKKVTWTLAMNGRTNAIPVGLDARWEIDALKEATVGNTPPVLSFVQGGAKAQGPKWISTTMQATVANPLTLNVWLTDDGKNRSRNFSGAPITVTWTKYRGAGTVTFEKAKPEVDKTSGQATTTATFSEPGEYWLKATANDSSGEGGGGFQCCWTNGIVKVSVKAGSPTASAKPPVVFRSAAEWQSVLDTKTRDAARATPPPDLVSAPVKSGEHYQINVVKRMKAPGPIAHAVGSEIHSIMDGSGTLVTDGKIVRPANAAAGSRGGGTVDGGQSRRVAKGDVVLVPPGVPHWYQAIDGSVTYLEIRFDVGAASNTPTSALTSNDTTRVLAGKAAATPAPLMFSAPVARGDKFQANIVKRTRAQGGGAHEVGTELHQIIEGAGTLVTGGTVVRRGEMSVIEGGDSRRVVKGDIVFIPVGTPHWYKDVEGSITYLETRFDVPLTP